MTLGRRVAIAGLAGAVGVLAGYAARTLTVPRLHADHADHLTPRPAEPPPAAATSVDGSGPAAPARADRPVLRRPATGELVPGKLLARDRTAGYATLGAAHALQTVVLKRLIGEVEGEYLLRACLERAGEGASDDLRLELDVRTRRDQIELLHLELLEPPGSPAVDACEATLVGTLIVPRTAAEAPYLEREGTMAVHTSLEGW